MTTEVTQITQLVNGMDDSPTPSAAVLQAALFTAHGGADVGEIVTTAEPITADDYRPGREVRA